MASTYMRCRGISSRMETFYMLLLLGSEWKAAGWEKYLQVPSRPMQKYSYSAEI